MKFISFNIVLFLFYSAFGQQAVVNEKIISEALEQVAAKYHLLPADVQNYRLSNQYVQKQNGSTHLFLNQTHNGLDVFNAQIQLHFSKKGKLIFSNSTFVRNQQASLISESPVIQIYTAFSSVLDTLSLPHISPMDIKFDYDSLQGNYSYFNNSLFYNKVRAQLGYEKIGNVLKLVYLFALENRSDQKMYAFKVAAFDGKVVQIINRTLECRKFHSHKTVICLPEVALNLGSSDVISSPKSDAVYNAFPIGIESPIHGSRALFSNIENVQASPFGWHDVDGIFGNEYTNTFGNNVFAYEDTLSMDDFGYSPDGGPSLNFDFPFDINASPVENIDAALTNLFVWNNFMHDVAYHYGFDEASGNFQMNNYGNGGEGYDPVSAEGLDGSGLNNANFGTPEDGIAPRMQMYVWEHADGNLLEINSPATIAGQYATGSSVFGLGAQFPMLTAEVILMNSGGINPTNGCAVPLNDLTGKIALIDRGDCIFVEKVLQAQNGGAVGVILVNNTAGGVFSMGGDDAGQVYIPIVSISMADGDLIKAELLNGIVNATLGGNVQINRWDSDFDNGVIAHEYGHGISNRLTGGPLLVDCLYNEEQAGEGWSDFFALIMTNPTNATANSERAIGNFVSNNSITGQGIRPYPYSRDMNINPFTYGDIQSVSIPHGVGSVWCTMIWDLYWNMIDEYGNSNDLLASDGGNNKAISLVVEGMRMQSCSPGFVDSRDAILAADDLLFDGLNSCLIWETFARRGLGYSANQGSSSFVGDEIESFDLPPSCLDVSVKEILAEDFHVFPVPSKQILQISNAQNMEIESIVIFDLSGKQVFETNIKGKDVQLVIADFEDGMYLLQFKSGSKTFQKKFIKG